MQEQSAGYVRSEKHGQKIIIEFSHPQGNSLPAALLADLSTHIHAAGMDEEVHVIILKSAGDRTFCAGASFAELSGIKNDREGEDFFNGFAHVINSMRKCPKIIIARIQGKCVGGGLGLAAAADYAIASATAEVRLSELEIGIGPFVVGPAVERKLGISAFSQLAIDAASWRTADWAKMRGLFSEVHAGTQELDESVERLANHLCHSSAKAIKEIKKMLWEGTGHWDVLLSERAKISGRLINSPVAQKALSAVK